MGPLKKLKVHILKQKSSVTLSCSQTVHAVNLLS